MAKAIVDPEELRRFAFNLKRFNEELKGEVNTINRQFSKLGDTWRDQEHAKFADSFTKMVKILNNFLDTSEKHIPFLLRKAESIQKYLGQG